MQPRDRLTAKEIQVATLVWQGLTNKDIAGVLLTSEQVVKNYLRTAFDKLGVWTRLELALYVASHGGANWHMQLGNGLLPPGAGWSVAQGGQPQFSGRPGISSTISSPISSPIKEKPSLSEGQL
jgi:DNA-binding CsgD family transcriptional regulator